MTVPLTDRCVGRPQAMFWTRGCCLLDLGPDWACFGPSQVQLQPQGHKTDSAQDVPGRAASVRLGSCDCYELLEEDWDLVTGT